MSDQQKSVPVIVILPAKVRDQVKQLATDQAVSMSAIGRRAIQRFVEQQQQKA